MARPDHTSASSLDIADTTQQAVVFCGSETSGSLHWLGIEHLRIEVLDARRVYEAPNWGGRFPLAQGSTQLTKTIHSMAQLMITGDVPSHLLSIAASTRNLAAFLQLVVAIKGTPFPCRGHSHTVVASVSTSLDGGTITYVTPLVCTSQSVWL